MHVVAVECVGYGAACSFSRCLSGSPLLFLDVRFFLCLPPLFFFLICLREMELQDSMVLGIFLQTLRVVFLPINLKYAI